MGPSIARALVGHFEKNRLVMLQDVKIHLNLCLDSYGSNFYESYYGGMFVMNQREKMQQASSRYVCISPRSLAQSHLLSAVAVL